MSGQISTLDAGCFPSREQILDYLRYRKRRLNYNRNRGPEPKKRYKLSPEAAAREKNRKRVYAEVNREKERARGRFRQSQSRITSRIWARANRDKRKAYYAKWKQTHPESYRAHLAKQGAIRRIGRELAGVEKCAEANTLIKTWAGDLKFKCYYCRKVFPTAQLHVDHFHPLSRGGKHEASNLRRSCASCNMSKKASICPTACWFLQFIPWWE